MAKVLSVIIPVLEGMEESHLKTQLLKYFPQQADHFTQVEESFSLLTSITPDPDRMKMFFHSWSQTKKIGSHQFFGIVHIGGDKTQVGKVVNFQVLLQHGLWATAGNEHAGT